AAWHGSCPWPRSHPTRDVSESDRRRLPVTMPVLSRVPYIKFAAALLALAVSAATPTAATDCGYPFASADPRSSGVFHGSTVLRAFSPQGDVAATSGLTIKVWYNDEHALTLGIRRVVVKTPSGTTTTDYPISALPKVPGSVLNPQAGTMALDGDQAGTDTS